METLIELNLAVEAVSSKIEKVSWAEVSRTEDIFKNHGNPG